MYCGGLPASLNGISAPLSICGAYADSSGGGVLEWCYDIDYAKAMLDIYRKNDKYIRLKIWDEKANREYREPYDKVVLF